MTSTTSPASPASSAPTWLFDIYPHPTRSSLVLWTLQAGDGDADPSHDQDRPRVRKRLIPYHPAFCVKAEAQPLRVAEDLLAEDDRVAETWREETPLWLRGPPREVLRVRPHRLQDLHVVATDLRRATASKGFLFFDVDHQPESRWMHERGLFPLCRLDPDAVRPDGVVAGSDLAPAADEDRWGIDYEDPPLRTMRLGVDVVERGHTPSFGDPLHSVRLGEVRLECAEPGDAGAERALLHELGRRLRAEDPDVLITRHGDRFDVPFLLRRIHDLGLHRELWLGRAPDPHPDHPDQKSKSLHTYGRWLFKTHAYYLRGRWHIDLSKKTLDSEDDRKDLHGIVYLSRVSNRRPQDVNRNGAGYALQQMQIDLATDLGVALPWKRNLAEDWKDAATLCAVDRGGQIMNPAPGIYEDVAACDFSGYYPSLVVRHNLSSDTIGCDCCADDPDALVVPELQRHICTEVYGHQAEILRRLWPHRRYVKAVLRQRSTGQGVTDDRIAKMRAIKSEHKALGVVCFGYFRYRNARFGCAEVHQAIQALGRRGMTRARTLAEEHGYDVVHTMTDCTFLQRPGVTRKDAMRIARRITKEVGVPMDVEGVFRWVVFLPSKTHSTSSLVGVPNRYYGKFEDGTLKVRGIEVQRHSTPDWVHDAQQGMLDVLGEADDALGFVLRIPRALQVAKDAADQLRQRKVRPADLGLLMQTRMGVEDYAANTTTRAAMERLAEAGLERRPGEYVKYVICRGDGPWEGRVMPIELLDEGSPWFEGSEVGYDVPTYLRLLARSVETLLSPFGYEEDAVYAWLNGAADSPRPRTEERLDVRRDPPWVRTGRLGEV